MKNINLLEGKVVAPEGMKVAIVASRFNEIIVNKLLGGAVDGLVRHGVEENNITATRVILPVSNDRNIPSRFGLRHRAAIGITEKTDAVSIVVSEENGQISYVKDGGFVFFDSEEELREILIKDLR